MLIIKPPNNKSIPLDCLDDIAQLLDGARSQLRALRGESEPHDGLVASSVDEDVLDCYVLRLALDCILEDWFALRDQRPLDNAEIDLKAVTESTCEWAVSIASPWLG